MEWPKNPLILDPEKTVQEIVDFIHNISTLLGRGKAVLGLSGGLDSSITAALTVKAIGSENVKFYYLPERDSKSIHHRHASLLAKQLDCELRIKNITPILNKSGVYRLLPLSLIPGQRLKSHLVEFGKKKLLPNSDNEILSARLNARGGSWIARANAYISAKHRIRSVILYKEAERAGSIVVGAANKTEWLTGTFTQWGCDHCADLMPLLHLYRSQLIPIAELLGIPREIIDKKADPDILPGLDDKGALLGSFDTADHILWGIENGFSEEFLCERFGKHITRYILFLNKNSEYYRKSPYNLG